MEMKIGLQVKITDCRKYVNGFLVTIKYAKRGSRE